MLTPETTLEDLRKLDLLSVRTVNALHYANINNIQDLFDAIAEGTNLLTLRNFGFKSLFEVNQLLKKIPQHITSNSDFELIFKKMSSVEQNAFVEAFNSITVDDKKISSYLKSLYSHCWDLIFLLSNRYEEVLEVCGDLSMSENVKLRKYYINFITKLYNILSDSKSNLKVVNLTFLLLVQRELTNKSDNFSLYDISRFFLSSECKKYIQEVYENLCVSHLSARAKGFVDSYINSFEGMVKLFDQPLSEYSKLCEGKHMAKTLREIYDFNKEFKRIFSELYTLDSEEIIKLRLKDKYPYLTSKQRLFVYDYKKETLQRPIFYLLINYLRLSNDPVNRMYSLYYGIFDNHEYSIDELQVISSYSKERIRQIIKGDLHVVDAIIYDKNELQQYYQLTNSVYICESDDWVSTLIKKEHLNCNFLAFSSIACLILPYSFFYIDSKNWILIKDDLIERLNFKKLIKQFVLLAKEKYKENTQVNLKLFFPEIPSDLFSDFLFVFRYIIKLSYGYHFSNDGIVTFPQNYIDIEYELFLILSKNNKVMSLEELFSAFKAKYPNHRYTDSQYLKPYLMKSQRMRSIGKTSTYALTCWSTVYFGSIRTLIFEILSSSDEPVHIDIITKKILEKYPETSQNSISATMQSDTMNRFISFVNGFFGLVGKSYSDEYIPLDPFKRKSFEDKINTYRNFINLYHRFPNGSFGEEEASLQRWHYNINHGNVILSPEQRIIFDKMIHSFDNSGFPRTQTENEFFNRCEEYKVFIKKQGFLPTPTFGKELYSWFRRSKIKYQGYNDQRYDYFLLLIKYLEEYGLDDIAT